MAWTVREDRRCPISRPYGVLRSDTDELVSCHETRAAAEAHQAVLAATVKPSDTTEVLHRALAEVAARREARAPLTRMEADMRASSSSSDGPPKPPGNVTYADPENGKYPIDTQEHARAAWAYINQDKNASQYSPQKLAQVKTRIMAACKRFGIDVGDGEKMMSQRAEATPAELADTPVEHRSATVTNVDWGQRIITVLAVPYEQQTPVEYRSQQWNEVISAGAFNGLDPARRRIPVSAKLDVPAFDHVGSKLCGKVAGAKPDHPDGLLLDMRISNTPVGDETLQLGLDDALSPSVGFACRPGDQTLDRQTMTRRVNRAFLDHVTMVPVPAYAGARILAMRAEHGGSASAAGLPPLHTPALDAFESDPIWQWASGKR